MWGDLPLEVFSLSRSLRCAVKDGARFSNGPQPCLLHSGSFVVLVFVLVFNSTGEFGLLQMGSRQQLLMFLLFFSS